jgi:ssDNA-binding Zn-finger/Zn-ribbon topoisomerase 1
MTLLDRVKKLERAAAGDACPVCGYEEGVTPQRVTFSSVTDATPESPDEQPCPECGNIRLVVFRLREVKSQEDNKEEAGREIE